MPLSSLGLEYSIIVRVPMDVMAQIGKVNIILVTESEIRQRKPSPSLRHDRYGSSVEII